MEESMSAFDFAHQHPWWTLIYLVLVAGMVISLCEAIIKRK